jgi:hypothetical protein
MNLKLVLYSVIFFVFVNQYDNARTQKRTQHLKESALVAMAGTSLESVALFRQYQDSLQQYFGLLEIDLIKNYKVSFDSIRTDEDFAAFFSNANAFKAAMERALERTAKKHTPLPNLRWLQQLVPGLLVKAVPEANVYQTYFSFPFLLAKAKETTGTRDDNFFHLMDEAYLSESPSPSFIQKNRDNQFCSMLGSGTHTLLLEGLEAILAEEANGFHEEAVKVRQLVVVDLMFTQLACNDASAAKKELQEIVQSGWLKEVEKNFLQEKLNKWPPLP